MAKNSFIIYTEYMEHIEMLEMEQRGVLMTALMCYQMEQELPEMDGMTKMCFSFIKARIDRDNEAYAERCRKNAENGAKGGRPRKANGSTEKRTVSEKANGFSENPTKAKKADTDTDIDIDNIKEKVLPKGNTKKKSAPRFMPPTVQQVEEYSRQSGHHVDAQRFVDFYESKGWMVGKNKMKDWKAAVRNWAKRDTTVISGTKFSNFPERRTDYDEIERKLIAQSMGV